jgi:uncharacterized surface protein with fasciclin (FAS1) repeats
MRPTRTLTLAAVAVLALAACDNKPAANETATSPAAEKAAGDKTLAEGIDANSKMGAALKAAGLDATLAGPGPYTVLAPDDAAFDKLPAGTLETLMKPEARADLTALLTYHILPGTVLAEDIGKAIDAGKGKAVLATMGGGTLTATKEDDAIVLSDSAGGKARIVEADDKRSNGVLHRIDGVLMPSQG